MFVLRIKQARSLVDCIWQFSRVHAIQERKIAFGDSPLQVGRFMGVWDLSGASGPMARLKKTVAMIGMMGAGKTAVGTALAKALGVPFLDSDDEIVSAANRSIAEIFERDGEEFFRARETEVLARLLRGKPCILSTGGGAFLSAGNRQLIHDAGVSVWLRADVELLWQRVRHKATRPLLRTPNPRETLYALNAAREAYYSTADLIVDSDADLSIDQMAQRVAKALATRRDVLEEDAP
jgi:shikimate kinase